MKSPLVRKLKCKRYLGDGAYAGFQPETGQLWLWTSDGLAVTNMVALNHDTLHAAKRYFTELAKAIAKVDDSAQLSDELSREFTVMQTLEVKHCPECLMAYAAPAEFFARKSKLHNEGRKGNWYCPAGHGIEFSGEPEIDKVRRERDRLKQETARLLEEKGAEISARRIAEKEIARQAKRSRAGVCSCCHRTFKQLAAHMRSKHPEAPRTMVGRQISGAVTASRMTKEQLSERGKKGAMARWGHA